MVHVLFHHSFQLGRIIHKFDVDMPPSMFHTGDLNSGISLAIREQKVVACFIRQEGEYWSQVWEDYWLANKSHPTDVISEDGPPLGLVLAEKAVLLRLEFGSQEAGFLSVFTEVQKAPTMVLIRDGHVLEKIEGGVGKEEFKSRLSRAVGLEVAASEGGQAGEDRGSQAYAGRASREEELVDDIGGRHVTPQVWGPDSAPEEPTTATSAARTAPTQVYPQRQSQPSQTAGPPPHSPSQPPPANVQSMLTERGQRLEAERLEREAAEKAERIARANARRKEAEDAAATHTDKGKQRASSDQNDKQQARDAWIYQQKQRKDEAKKERERILKQIESDKQERKAQAARRKEAEMGGMSEVTPSEATANPPSSSAARAPTHASTCQLLVRLFDGASIKGKFASDADVSAVRAWVKEASPEGGADIPYCFRQILAPQPSRTIEVGEEARTLQELGLVPSATLVLVPIAGSVDAYGGPTSGYMSSAWNAISSIYGLAGSTLGYITGYGSGVNATDGEGGLYMGGIGDEQEPSNQEGARMAGSDSAAPGGGTVKTLFDQRREQVKDWKQGTEFYNGNSSAFEGRKGDDDET